VVGAALEGIAACEESTAQTQAGKVANAALGAGGGALTMANPIVAVAELVAPRGYKLSEVYRGTAGALSSIGEGLATGDTRAMDEFHQRAMKGSYGKVMGAASEAGEFWAERDRFASSSMDLWCSQKSGRHSSNRDRSFSRGSPTMRS
jgi:hypothetical protein